MATGIKHHSKNVVCISLTQGNFVLVHRNYKETDKQLTTRATKMREAMVNEYRSLVPHSNTGYIMRPQSKRSHVYSLKIYRNITKKKPTITLTVVKPDGRNTVRASMDYGKFVSDWTEMVSLVTKFQKLDAPLEGWETPPMSKSVYDKWRVTGEEPSHARATKLAKLVNWDHDRSIAASVCEKYQEIEREQHDSYCASRTNQTGFYPSKLNKYSHVRGLSIHKHNRGGHVAITAALKEQGSGLRETYTARHYSKFKENWIAACNAIAEYYEMEQPPKYWLKIPITRKQFIEIQEG